MYAYTVVHKGHNHFSLRVRPYPPETYAIVVLGTYIVHVQAGLFLPSRPEAYAIMIGQ
jgi:hypothetical protein